MDYTVHGILQARILEWVAFPFSRGSSQPRDQTQVSRIAGGFFTSRATMEAMNVGVGNLSLEKAMAPHSSTLAWRIPWVEEPGGLQSMGSLRVRHDWATSLSLFTFLHWRRKRQPTPVFLPGESQGRGSLVGCRLWSRTESDMTEATQQQPIPSQVDLPDPGIEPGSPTYQLSYEGSPDCVYINPKLLIYPSPPFPLWYP